MIPQRSWALATAAIAAGATLIACLPFAPGIARLMGFLLAAATTGLAGLALWAAVPQAMVVIVPSLIPSPMFMLTFAWEIALIALAVAVLLHGWRRNAGWLWRLDAVERWLLLFALWGLFSGFWSTDPRFFLIGARRLLLGLCALWVATRLPYVASRRWFDFGLVAGASALALSAIHHSLTSGLSQAQALLHRPEVTNLGWGTANYVATLLLLFAPRLMQLALRGAVRERVIAWGAFGLVTVTQFIIASRAATVLFLAGTLIQLLRAARRFRFWIGLMAVAAVLGLLASPLGSGLLSRVGSMRELGSITIRLMYFREGFRRLVDNLPWGLGLDQGYSNADRLQGIDPHNYWLLVGGDLGIPGLLLWAGVLVAIVRKARAVPSDEPGRDTSFTLLLTFALANLHTLIEPTFQGVQYQFLFFWITCGSMAYATADRSRHALDVGDEPAIRRTAGRSTVPS